MQLTIRKKRGINPGWVLFIETSKARIYSYDRILTAVAGPLLSLGTSVLRLCRKGEKERSARGSSCTTNGLLPSGQTSHSQVMSGSWGRWCRTAPIESHYDGRKISVSWGRESVLQTFRGCGGEFHAQGSSKKAAIASLGANLQEFRTDGEGPKRKGLRNAGQ